VKQAGWRVFYVDDAPITHVGSLSTGMADQTRRMPRYWFESRRRYFVKHHGRAYAALCDVAWLLGHAIYQAKAALQPGSSPTRPHLGRDFARFSLTELLRPAPFAPQNQAAPPPDARLPVGSPLPREGAQSQRTPPEDGQAA
jgi:N-acetylglucosaminyl-diphospho-decaprenol L-rhamnosyltransferase